jgi:hypothetical protein
MAGPFRRSEWSTSASGRFETPYSRQADPSGRLAPDADSSRSTWKSDRGEPKTEIDPLLSFETLHSGH